MNSTTRSGVPRMNSMMTTASCASTGTRRKRMTPSAKPKIVPPTMAMAASCKVTASPAPRNAAFLTITSSIGDTRVHALPREPRDGLAEHRDQQQIEQRDHDVDLEGAEGLSLDGAGLIGELGDGEHRGERGILDELR